MKKFCVSVMTALCVMFVCSVAMCYPEHLGGDEDYIICDGHHGIGYYLDKTSINVEQYNPPNYIIAVDVAMVEDADRGNTEIWRVETRHYYYNWDEQTMYLQNKNGEWKYLNPRGSRASGATKILAGKIAFRLAYGMEFEAR